MSLEQELLALDKALWTGGPATYQAQTDDQCLVVFSEMAGVMPRDEIAEMSEERRWSNIAMTPQGFVQLSDTAAIIAYDCTARRKDGVPYHALVSSGYVRRADGWKLAFHQQTEVA